LGYNIEGAFAMMQFMQDTLHACQDSEVVKEYDKIDSDRVVCIGSNSTLAAMAGVDVASSIAASVAAALNGGPSLSVSLMINAAIAAAFIGYMGIEIDTLVDARNSHGE
jgi:hypothetical protein